MWRPHGETLWWMSHKLTNFWEEDNTKNIKKEALKHDVSADIQEIYLVILRYASHIIFKIYIQISMY